MSYSLKSVKPVEVFWSFNLFFFFVLIEINVLMVYLLVFISFSPNPNNSQSTSALLRTPQLLMKIRECRMKSKRRRRRRRRWGNWLERGGAFRCQGHMRWVISNDKRTPLPQPKCPIPIPCPLSCNELIVNSRQPSNLTSSPSQLLHDCSWHPCFDSARKIFMGRFVCNHPIYLCWLYNYLSACLSVCLSSLSLSPFSISLSLSLSLYLSIYLSQSFSNP